MGKSNSSTTAANTADCTTYNYEETSTEDSADNSVATAAVTKSKISTAVATAISNIAASAVATKVIRSITAMFKKIMKKGRTNSDAWDDFKEILDNHSEDAHECIH